MHRSREGDFLETNDNFIFDVKGIVHPPDRVIAYLRYVPDEKGGRTRLGVRYRKVYGLSGREAFLRKNAPCYLYFDSIAHRRLQGVPLEKIKILYEPKKKLEELSAKRSFDPMERDTLELVELLRSATGLDSGRFGISGSLLVGLHDENSDIDLIVYGVRESHKVLNALKGSQHDALIERYDKAGIERLYEARSMRNAMSFNRFMMHEKRKFLEGRFRTRDYFIRCIKDWNEIKEKYGDRSYYPVGSCTLEAVVEDDSENILTPCTYGVSQVKILRGKRKAVPSQIVSFRGRFCEQAFQGERVRARGRLERVVNRSGEWYRIVIGESRFDYLKLKL